MEIETYYIHEQGFYIEVNRERKRQNAYRHYKHWIGTFYPEGTKAAEQLAYYQKFFKTVEINSSFYGIPSPNTFENWKKAVPADFVYVRLHGPGDKYQGSYTDTSLKKWAGQCLQWQKEGKDVYVYFDNDQLGYAAFNARDLAKLVQG